jgi:hypothetical protein
MESGSTCRVEVRAAGSDEPLAHFSIPHYDADNQHYRISALWMEDATAFALNVDSGRSITYCRIFISNPDGWTELSLPRKPIEKVRKAGNAKEPLGSDARLSGRHRMAPQGQRQACRAAPRMCSRSKQSNVRTHVCLQAIRPGSAEFSSLVRPR